LASRTPESLIDSHCHLDFDEFAPDRDELVQRAFAQGIKGWVIPGVTLQQSKELLAFTLPVGDVFFALGLHPYFLAQHQDTDLQLLDQLIEMNHARIVAVGECGLDSSVGDIDRQTRLFEGQIHIANHHQLPLIVHHRQSHHLIAQSFKKAKPKQGGIIHAFSGSLQQANYYRELGFKLGIGGTITYERAQKTKYVVAELPLDTFVLETDGPSMPLNGYQGKRNEPEQLVRVFESFCSLRAEPKMDIAAALARNTCDVLGVEISS